VCNCSIDDGRPLGTGWQEHRRRNPLRAATLEKESNASPKRTRERNRMRLRATLWDGRIPPAVLQACLN
jgi:hypothetical protein